ncbi:MAG: hypothetical protein U0414_20715 [Polyangiaceae bacterium]
MSARRLGAAVLVALGGAGCSSQAIATMVPGVVNAAGNRELRRDLLSFGTKTLCPELLKRSVPLRLRNDDPNTGRFFVRSCALKEQPKSGNLLVQWAGVGYGWSNLTKRIGFETSATVEYDQDFRVENDKVYLYFRPVSGLQPPQQVFTLKMAEQVATAPFGPLIAVGSPMEFAGNLGTSLLAHELERGFTVVRESDGSTDFALGLVPPGTIGGTGFYRSDTPRTVLANENIEIHANERDFAGPFEVESNGDALYLTMTLEGTTAVDILVYQRSQGDVWLQQYFQETAPTAPPTPPIFDDTVNAGMLYRRLVRVPKGSYYVVIDNTATAGRTPPLVYGDDDRAAFVSLAVERGSAP